MPKDWKRYTTAGLTFATIIVIGFVMQNGQKTGPQEQIIAGANMGQSLVPQPGAEPGAEVVPASLPDMTSDIAPVGEASAAALGAASSGSSVPAPGADLAGVPAGDAAGLALSEEPGANFGREKGLVASLADTVTWGGRARSAASAPQAGGFAAVPSDGLEARQGLAQGVETASLGDAGTAPMPALPREEPVASGNCEISMKAAPQAAALVDLTLEAPCLPNERVTLHHNGMMFTETTDMQGNLALSVPALTENAVFIASFANGDGAVANATVTSLGFYDRAVVQSEAENAVALHALEFGADYADQGHIWADAPGDIVKAAQGEGGFLMVLGNPAIAKGMMAQVYSFPAGFAQAEGGIALSVEIEVTEANCGRPVDAQSIEAVQGGALSVQTLEMTMPDCDAVGDFLVLKNLVNDLKVAKN